MGDGTNIQLLQAEIDAVAKQMQTVEANSKAVESAIVAKGTFRGYHGEDLFLKRNLGTVQAEMVKQLLRRDRILNVKRRELLDRLGPDAAAVGGSVSYPSTAPPFPGANSSVTANSGVAADSGIAVESRGEAKSNDAADSGDTANGGNTLDSVDAANGKEAASIDVAEKTSDTVKSCDAANNGDAGTVSAEATQSPLRDRPPHASVVGPAVSFAPHRSERPPSPMEVSSPPATPARSSPATLSADAMSPPPEMPEKDAPAGCAGFVAISGGYERMASNAQTTKTIPHMESRPRSAVDPRRDDVSYARPVVLASPLGGKRILMPPAPADRAAGGAAGNGIGSGSRSYSATPKKKKRRDSINAVAPRPLKSSRRGQSDTPGPAHSVAEYLANTQRGRDAVASISEGTVFWIKFSDTKEAWLECGVVKKMHPKSAKPYEVEWRPYDSTGCILALNPKKRIALTPRLFVGKPEDFEPAVEGDPPAGTAPPGEFKTTTKRHVLTVPPIGSWCVVKEDQPWGNLGPFAF